MEAALSEPASRPHRSFGRKIEELDIACIDDSRAMLQLLRHLLAPTRPKRVRVFETVREGLPKLLDDPPDLLIADWVMEEISGTDLIRMIRQPRFGPIRYCSAIVLTGQPLSKLVPACLEAAVNLILIKPVSPIQLHDRIRWITNDPRQLENTPNGLRLEGAEVLKQRLKRNRPMTGLISELAHPKTQEPETPDTTESEDNREDAVNPDLKEFDLLKI